MVNKIVTFTTYKSDGATPSGTPFVFGFTDKLGNNGFDNTGTSTEADLEIPPPPPPGDGAGNPISTSYIDTMYVKVSDGENDINAYQYFVDSSDNSDISLNLAVRDYNTDNDNNVVFKYDVNDVSGVFTTLAITNGTWTIDLVGASVTGTGPSVTENGDERTVTLPHLGNDLFYTMNLKQYVVDSGPVRLRGNVNNDYVDGNNVVDVADLVFLQKWLNNVTEQVTIASNDSNFSIGANLNEDEDKLGNPVIDVADLVFLQKHLNSVVGYEISGTSFPPP